MPNQACGSLDCHRNCMKPLKFVCWITKKDKLGLTGFGFSDCMKWVGSLDMRNIELPWHTCHRCVFWGGLTRVWQFVRCLAPAPHFKTPGWILFTCTLRSNVCCCPYWVVLQLILKDVYVSVSSSLTMCRVMPWQHGNAHCEPKSKPEVWGVVPYCQGITQHNNGGKPVWQGLPLV